MSFVNLECVAERNGKLRIRITSPGYFNDANCMFPRDIRAVGAKYRVPASDVSLITKTAKYYYSVKKNNIQIITDAEHDNDIIMDQKIFEDASITECAICFENPKSVIIRPCGHYYLCGVCSQSVDKCPICRSPIAGFINRDEMA